MKQTFIKACLMATACTALVCTVQAQYTLKVAAPVEKPVVHNVDAIHAASVPAEARRTLLVNADVTTFIIAGEEIKLMDISVPRDIVVGNQPSENIVRIKPVGDGLLNGQDLGILTVVGERNITQFNLVYVKNPDMATTQYNIQQTDGVSYLNPGVDMPRQEMYMYCWRIMNSRERFYDVSAKGTGMRIRLNNIYAIGNYFFLDYTLMNRTNIPFDIEETRVMLSDKKRVKAVNSQDVELEPVLNFNSEQKRFKKDYRNILVLPKMTFPDEKILTITVNEKQISGRGCVLTIDYQDVLQADAFHHSMN